MKCKLLSGLLWLTLVGTASSETVEFYVNDAIVNCPPGIPPQVDALNFVNNNFFSINFTNPFVVNPQLYETVNTLNYTNFATMIGNSGFRFETSPTGAGQRRMAANWVNSGTISAGSIGNTNLNALTFFFVSGLPKVIVSATNTAHSGTIQVGADGLLQLTGKKVDLNRGALVMEGFDLAFTNSNFFTNGNLFLLSTVGIFDRYWGIGTNVMNPFFDFEFPPPTSPPSRVTTLLGGSYFQLIQQLTLNNGVAYVSDTIIGTNRFVSACFLNNTNAAISNNVYFQGFIGDISVEWLAAATNVATGAVTTNYLYLFDDFGTGGTNRLITNNFSGLSGISAQPTFIPANYTFLRGGPLFLGMPAVPGLPPGTFDPDTVTNQYAAYAATFLPVTQQTNYAPGSVITNLPGRIEITADNELNLTRARISALNYLSLKATNHFVGSTNAQISSPFTDINLGSTNGRLTVASLLQPTVPRFTGEVDLWSGRWTNDFGGLRSRYHVLFVDSLLQSQSPAYVQDFRVRSTNVIISDVLNILRTLYVDGENLTITTNPPGTPNTRGELNLATPFITWSSALPRLKNLTNNGAINAQNAVFFGGARTSPFFSTGPTDWYDTFINRGTISDQDTHIYANYFENTGFLSAGLGSIALQSLYAGLTNGFFLAGGDIALTSATLVISNHVLQAGRTLSFAATNLLTDTGASNANTWSTSAGLNLYAKPAAGDLLGSGVLSTAPVFAEVFNHWAGEDRGCSTAGFTNNVALGRLILDGGFDSLFTFTGTGANNGLYVDYLELRNFTTNRDAGGNFIGLQVDPNMKIYFAQAVANGISVAEKLDGRNGGRFCWVSDYAGIYSSTNIVYPDGTTNTFNTALVTSCNLDSDGDGLVNCADPTPILRPQDLALAVSVVNAPGPKALVSWQSGPYAANTVYYKTSLGATNWQMLTNFVSGPQAGRVAVSDPINPASPRYYRVRVDTHQQ